MLMMQGATPGELGCLGFIADRPVAMDLFIAGTEEDEVSNYAHTGTLVYVNGPGVSGLKAGDQYVVVRPEGKVRDKVTGELIGIYHLETGVVRIETVRPDSATASVLNSCHVILKGDILLPLRPRTAVRFEGQPSNSLTPFTDQNLMSTIVLGKEGIKEMGEGHFCFIGIGSRDGVKVGDRFTIYRPQPPFHTSVFDVQGSKAGLDYEKVTTGHYRLMLVEIMKHRKVPPRVLGDLLIVDVSDTTAGARIISSLAEIHPGDLVVRR